MKVKNILILGRNGFIGSSLFNYLSIKYDVNYCSANSSFDELEKSIVNADVIIHVIGVTRSNNENDYFNININFSYNLYSIICKYEDKCFIYFSSIHFHRSDIYGFSKRYNEYLFSKEEFVLKNKTFMIRTPGIFGPGAKPNNVSVVSTFCFNKVHNINSTISDPTKILELFYIDDLCKLVEELFYLEIHKYKIISPPATYISVIELFNIINKIGCDTSTDIDLSNYNTDFIKNISNTYNSFNNA